MTLTLTLHLLGRLWPLLAFSGAALFGLSTMLVALIEPLGGIAVLSRFIEQIPMVSRIMGTAGLDFTTHAGFASFAYVHPLSAIVLLLWPVGVAASALVGDLESGFADQTLSRAVPRRATFLAPTLTLLIGSVALGLAMWMGTAFGARLSPPPEPLPMGRFLLAGLILVLLTFATGSVALLISASSRDRGRVVLVVFALWLVNYFNARLAPAFASLDWLMPWSLTGHARPVTAVRFGEIHWEDLAVLTCVSAVSLVLGAIIWSRRDMSL